MGLPKRKISKSRRDKRRSHHALHLPQLTTCPKCYQLKRQHYVCEACGFYEDRQIIEIKEKKKK